MKHGERAEGTSHGLSGFFSGKGKPYPGIVSFSDGKLTSFFRAINSCLSAIRSDSHTLRSGRGEFSSCHRVFYRGRGVLTDFQHAATPSLRTVTWSFSATLQSSYTVTRSLRAAPPDLYTVTSFHHATLPSSHTATLSQHTATRSYRAEPSSQHAELSSLYE